MDPVRIAVPGRPGWWLAVSLIFLSALLAIPAAADAPAGRVVSASGGVIAVRADESARSLGFGEPVRVGDEVRTGPAGRVQIRFHDGGLVDLRPGTRFAIDRYGRDEDGKGRSAVMRFLQGALRTITGAIGKGAGDTYAMKTSVATLGVRGTGYELEYCDRACARRGDAEPGLYGRVSDGVIEVRTTRSSVLFSAGDYLFVPDADGDGLPRPILQPPAGVLRDSVADGGDAVYTGMELALPPGLAGMDELPPGLARMDQLPPGLSGGLPPGLSGELPPGLSGGLPPGLSGGLPPGLSGDPPPGLSGEAPPGLGGNLPPGLDDNLAPGLGGKLPPGLQ